ncbi:hypothetical protein OSB04_009714 [Centaurea solstitialis]|uniref:Uncharacterized protein n=1 Tax=Centaurea solstitialis TaxID=347529 RepID=A0AA38THY9_9ASTR|nr:hypothetical protein OSB04_009714 [Centaurea solstitialis]
MVMVVATKVVGKERIDKGEGKKKKYNNINIIRSSKPHHQFTPFLSPYKQLHPPSLFIISFHLSLLSLFHSLPIFNLLLKPWAVLLFFIHKTPSRIIISYAQFQPYLPSQNPNFTVSDGRKRTSTKGIRRKNTQAVPEPDRKTLSKPEFFAGSAFVDSPPPSSVPLPGFFTKSFVATARVDPTTDLRRILGLSLS